MDFFNAGEHMRFIRQNKKFSLLDIMANNMQKENR